jgi:hypothetical protein
MTLHEFQPGLDRLVNLFKPFEWDENRGSEYYRIFQFWTSEKWNRAIDKVLMTAKRMPTPAHISESIEAESDKDTTVKPLLDDKGCPSCHRGMVHCETEYEGETYERFMACDCEAGDKVARHIILMARKRGMSLSNADARYSFRYGPPPQKTA